MPNISTRLSGIFVILGAFVVLSYFTHVAWWAFAGLSFFLGGMTFDLVDENHQSSDAVIAIKLLAYLFAILSLVCFVAGVIRTGWIF
jgi:hypothetical protein